MKALVAISILALSIGLLLGGGALVSGWSDHYALAVKTAAGWSLQEDGRGGWLLLTAGSLAGLVLGGVAGVLAGSRIWEMFARHENAELAERIAAVDKASQKLAVERNDLLASIETARHEGIEIAFKRAWERESALVTAQRQVKVAEERVKRLEGQLKGAQGRASRKAKPKRAAESKIDEIGNLFHNLGVTKR